MLFRTLKALITKGKTDGLSEKIDIFFVAGKLTESEYNELNEMLTSTSTEV